MQLVVIDHQPDLMAALVGRLQEAMRQAEVRRIEIIEVNPAGLARLDWPNVVGCLIGPGCIDTVSQILEEIRSNLPVGPVATILEAETYDQAAVGLRKQMSIQILRFDDLTQLAGFVIDCDSAAASAPGGQHSKGVVGVCQLKGGVGNTTIATAIAGCWARHGLSVAAIDLDDLNPQLTAWGRVGIAQRTVASELLRAGEVPAGRVNELVYPVEGFDGKFVIVGQPDAYNESFHFKANVIEGAPSAAEYIQSLIFNLQSEFDAVVIDMARSWGIASFATLPLCQAILLVTDDDGMSVRRTLDTLQRLKKESDDSDEFDFSRWSLVLNGYTGQLISPKEIAAEIQEMELFPAESNLYTVPFSESGRQWGAPGQTFFDTAEAESRKVIRNIASAIIPFRYEPEQSMSDKFMKRWKEVFKR